MIDVNTGLIAVIAVLLVLQHLRQSDCREQSRTDVHEARREEISRSKTNTENAFAVWREALREAKAANKESENNE